MGKSLWWLGASRRTSAYLAWAWGRDCRSKRSVLLIYSFDLSARTARAAIETETDRVQWAAAGSNVTLYLTAVDPIHLDVGRVLCPPTAPVELASAFTARIIVFDIQVPILAGTSVSEKFASLLPLQTMFHALVQIELFHHSRDVPAAISKLNVSLDRASGAVTKQNPRFVRCFFSPWLHLTPTWQGSDKRRFCRGPDRYTTDYIWGDWYSEHRYSLRTLFDKQGNGPHLDP
jgi:hypothetical protein